MSSIGNRFFNTLTFNVMIHQNVHSTHINDNILKKKKIKFQDSILV